MRVVMDSNALVTAALADPQLRVLRRHELLGPAVVWSEAMSVVHEGLWRREISSEYAVAVRDGILDLRVDVVADRAIYTAAWDVAERFGLAKTYDALYVALAKRRDVPLLTQDRRLRRTVGDYVETIGLADL